jgi:ATP-dependent Clp protease protease subunit
LETTSQANQASGPNEAGPDDAAAVTQPPPAHREPVFVSFSAEITPHTTESLLATMANLVAQGVRQVHLLLSTPGGSVMNGMNLYNVLKGLPFELTTHNVGNVDSIGNAIFLAGKHRYACPQSTFMFHGVGLNTMPGQRLDEKFVRETLASIVADHTRIGVVIREHTNLSEVEVAELFREQQTKDATYAISHGIIHEIRDVEIPEGCPIVSLVFQRQAI